MKRPDASRANDIETENIEAAEVFCDIKDLFILQHASLKFSHKSAQKYP